MLGVVCAWPTAQVPVSLHHFCGQSKHNGSWKDAFRWATPIISGLIKSMSFVLITKCSIHEVYTNRSSFTSQSQIY